ncbi:hypothetical protein M527_07090 [Sphingobium indicum IP26]|uniref:Uncharacterized protein n=1 Tax=Sphingobium indicum F2 TaxID=1450518 RepID=A0A8E0WSZ2_9SPHN|nr:MULTISPECIES: hypothetical protein [Sphingobium]EPR09883.1 hypothetical protein M527_07090 [Sphingobium indicum IP26]EQB05011.1 hypothetical protein L286_09605 [Sphingobium sp. HDIP04]KER36679.1 hypothetical protein AL00_09395 [Sphingobium indicum F2]
MSSTHVVAGDRLKRELERSAEAADCTIDWIVERSGPWNSPSFTGGRHALTMLVTNPSNRAWVEDLDEHSVYLPGFVLAQLDVGAIEEKGEQLLVEIEAVTVKEA